MTKVKVVSQYFGVSPDTEPSDSFACPPEPHYHRDSHVGGLHLCPNQIERLIAALEESK